MDMDAGFFDRGGGRRSKELWNDRRDHEHEDDGKEKGRRAETKGREGLGWHGQDLK